MKQIITYRRPSIREIYLGFCAFSVFRGLFAHPLFARFLAYCRTTAHKDDHLQLDAYGAFVGEIYRLGGDLTAAVRKLVFEDENVYVTRHANGLPIDDHLFTAVAAELSILSDFAALNTDDFRADLTYEGYLPTFASEESSDLTSDYEERIRSISTFGYGIFSSYGMFRLSDSGEIEPILSADAISLDSFVGYEAEREKVISNTEAFLSGRPAANVLLYGDAGTGKSSTVKAIANAYFDKGLRLIEIRKDQLSSLPYVMGKIRENPLHFIIFIDDLSFLQNDDNFSMLKAALEGSASARAQNAVIYATSNRRHIVKESFSDRESGDDLHRNDTVQETLSLSERFGLTVLFAKPNKILYLEIVFELAEKYHIDCDPEWLKTEAEAFALRRGYRSARCAEQFIESLL
ncbi:MAG: ATP-binding protein [Clostridia bacterium]|nr:ATP-binding protein [Clostridia bacterium]